MSISSVEIIKEEEITGNKIRINALTPIETHSTLLKSDGGKKTYYYSPSESEYSKLINENLRKKWAAYYREECPYNLKVQDIIMFVLVKEIGFDFLVYFLLMCTFNSSLVAYSKNRLNLLKIFIFLNGL